MGRLAVALATIVLLGGCAPREQRLAASSEPIVVLAASSLKKPLDGLVNSSFANVRISYAGSQDLAAQIEAGAPADVFVSAGSKYMDMLVEKGLIERTAPQAIASNRLAVVFRRDLDPPLAALSDLNREGLRLVVGDPKVPVGSAAESFAANWEQANGKPLFEKIRIASYEQSDRALVSKVRLGEADAAVVYESDALNEPSLGSLAIPEELNVTIVYYAAALAKPKNKAGAKRIVEVLSQEGLEGLLPKPGG